MRDPTRKAMTFHDLRATAITWCAVRGDDPLKIKQRAGHASFSTTEGYIREAENGRRLRRGVPAAAVVAAVGGQAEPPPSFGFGFGFGPMPIAVLAKNKLLQVEAPGIESPCGSGKTLTKTRTCPASPGNRRGSSSRRVPPRFSNFPRGLQGRGNLMATGPVARRDASVWAPLDPDTLATLPPGGMMFPSHRAERHLLPLPAYRRSR